MARHVDETIKGVKYRITPINVMDGEWILKLMLETDVPTDMANMAELLGQEAKGPKGRPITHAEWDEVRKLLLAQCFEVKEVNGTASLMPVITFDGTVIGPISEDLIAMRKLVKKALSVLVVDPFFADLVSQASAAAQP